MLHELTYMWNLKKYNELVNYSKKKKKKNQTQIQRINYWLLLGRRRGRGNGGKGVITRLYEIMSVKLLKIVKPYRIKRIFHLIKKISKIKVS